MISSPSPACPHHSRVARPLHVVVVRRFPHAVFRVLASSSESLLPRVVHYRQKSHPSVSISTVRLDHPNRSIRRNRRQPDPRCSAPSRSRASAAIIRHTVSRSRLRHSEFPIATLSTRVPDFDSRPVQGTSGFEANRSPLARNTIILVPQSRPAAR